MTYQQGMCLTCRHQDSNGYCDYLQENCNKQCDECDQIDICPHHVNKQGGNK